MIQQGKEEGILFQDFDYDLHEVQQILYKQRNQSFTFYWTTLKSKGKSDITAFIEVLNEPSTGTRIREWGAFPDIPIKGGKYLSNYNSHWSLTFNEEQAEEGKVAQNFFTKNRLAIILMILLTMYMLWSFLLSYLFFVRHSSHTW